MAWDYAELSKAAKEVGGPEKLMDVLVESGKDVGHREMLPLVGIAVVVGALGYAGIIKLVEFFKKKGELLPEEVEKAKKELIQGIEKYDEEHTTNDEEFIKKERDTI